MDLLPIILLIPALFAVAYFDLRYMRIPNVLVLIAIGLFILTAPLLGWPEVWARLSVALMVFAFGIVVFALGLFGGGDVKMMAALMLFVPSQTYPIFALGFSAAMIIGVFVVLLLRTAPWLKESSWVTLRQRGTFPMGISIAMAGVIHPFVVTFLAA